MMQTALIKKLRGESRFEEAYKLSQADLERNPQDIWAKRNHAWSLYYLIKKHVQAGEADRAKHFLKEFEEMQMPSDEVLLYERIGYFSHVVQEDYLKAKQLIASGQYLEAFDLHVSAALPEEQLAWAMYYLLRGYNKNRFSLLQAVRERCSYFRDHVHPVKKLVFKLILQELIKTPPEFWENFTPQSAYLEFLGLFDVLEEEDYQKQEWEGKKIIALAERLHIAYSKALLREGASKEKVQNYLTQIVEPKLESNAGMLYVPFFKAKLLLGTGEREEGLRAFLPFAQKKQKEFWVWQVFAEAYSEDEVLYLSCLCKAMTCKSKPEFLCGIKERLIGYLVAKGHDDWAKTELDELVRLRQKMEWGLRTHHQAYLQSPWYLQSKGLLDAGRRYQGHLAAAEALLGGTGASATQVDIVVTQVNKAKRVFNFVTDDKKEGFAKYREEPELWEAYRVTGSFGEGLFFKVKSMEKSKDMASIGKVRKEVEGIFRSKAGQVFGFVDGVFVPPDLVSAYRLASGMGVKGFAVLTPIKGKKDWGWKLVKVALE
ncbi:MAG: hypothetical protein JJU34_14145 [Lunatimonas sp.]|uniref:DUF7017 domain-containing protein n=1 Tax=Lunatimonas sp. TaxID=2060141 RepID=UPI00263B50D6|nr:hypothetical protein [Lunatimonas sp.]MCC5938415.1 hypothetical protein [Lunatimonas sp.]